MGSALNKGLPGPMATGDKGIPRATRGIRIPAI